MATVPEDRTLINGKRVPEETEVEAPERLHRLRTVRNQQGVSQRRAARQMGMDMKTVRAQEEESTDLSLSDLYKWQQVLDVPIADLLTEQTSQLSQPVLERARLVKLMKSVAAIKEVARSPNVRLLAERMFDQLLEIMPELEEIGPWHSVGQRRNLEDYGQAYDRRISDDLLYRPHHQE